MRNTLTKEKISEKKIKETNYVFKKKLQEKSLEKNNFEKEKI